MVGMVGSEQGAPLNEKWIPERTELGGRVQKTLSVPSG